MAELWEVLRFDQVADEIAEVLKQSADLILVDGAPGVGKSILLKQLGTMWETGGGSTVVAEGDRLRSSEEFYPLRRGLAALSSGWRTIAPLAGAAAAASESMMLGTGGKITETVEALSKLGRKRRRARKLYLGDDEQEILFDLARASRRKPLLLIAYNVNSWDPSSLGFLEQLREERLRDAFPFLTRLRVLAAQTAEPYEQVAHPIPHGALFSPRQTHRIDLRPVPQDRFSDVLVALGAPPSVDAATVEAIFALSGGHLLRARECAERLATDPSMDFLAAAASEDFITRLISDRLESLGAVGRQAVRMLEIAAVLGLSFRRDEITCAWDGSEAEALSVLRSCRGQRLLAETGEHAHFVHDMYRDHFLTSGNFDRVAVHERLDDCLRELRPAEYELRCENAVHAERPAAAAAFTVHAELRRIRDGRTSTPIGPAVREALTASAQVLDQFLVALEHAHASRLTECVAALTALPRTLPRSLAAEADYIRATCLLTSRSRQNRMDALSILEQWDGYEDEEPEIGVRLMQLRLFGLTLNPDKSEGSQLEGRIRQSLHRRAAFDRAAEDALYTLDRCSPSLCKPDAAIFRVQEAVAHYEASEPSGVVRRPHQYFRALVNEVAELIVAGSFSEAAAAAGVLDDFVADYVPDTFPRLDYPATNRLLADFRTGTVTAADAAELQAAITEELAVDADPFYSGNAQAVYLALAGRLDEAEGVLDELLAAFSARPEPEANMLYVLSANRLCTRFVAGNRRHLERDWKMLEETVRRIPYPIAEFLILRHVRLADVFAQGGGWTPAEFDECLLERPESGPHWQQLGRGFRLPEIQWWH